MKRLLSAMLALCMLLSVLCAAPITAKAGGGAAYVCSQVEMDFLLPAIGSS